MVKYLASICKVVFCPSHHQSNYKRPPCHPHTVSCKIGSGEMAQLESHVQARRPKFRSSVSMQKARCGTPVVPDGEVEAREYLRHAGQPVSPDQ